MNGGGLSAALEGLDPEERDRLLERLRRGRKASAEATPAAEDARPSFAQQRMWYLDQLANGVGYNLPVAIRLRGRLSAPRLVTALVELQRRHATLRTLFTMADGRVVQRVVEPCQDLPVTDLSEVPSAGRMRLARDLIDEESARRFHLAEQPPMRARLLTTASEDAILVLTIHHIAADEWSMSIVLRDLCALYSGRESELPPLRMQYRDYVAWQEAADGGRLRRQYDHWLARLAGLQVLDLPTDRPRGAQARGRGRCSGILPAAMTARIKQLCRSVNVTPFMFLVAIMDVLLQRCTGQDDTVLGTGVAGRTRTELEDLVGIFVNALVLRCDLGGDPTFLALLERVRIDALAAYGNQDVPFDRLVEMLDAPRDPHRHPVFQVVVILQNTPRSLPDVPGLRVDLLKVRTWMPGYDLALSVTELSETMVWTLEYDTGLFDRSTATRFMAQLRTLAQSALERPASPISQLASTAGGEPARGVGALPAMLDAETVVERFHRVAAEAPDRVACRQGWTSWTYGVLARWVGTAACALVADGVRDGTAVGVLSGGPATAAALLAVWSAGGVVVPIDSRLPVHRQFAMLRAAKAARLIVTGDAPPWLDRDLPIHVLSVRDGALRGARTNDPSPPGMPPPDRERTMAVFFTSGSTGIPKAVVSRHKALSHFLAWQRSRFAVGSEDRCAQLVGFSYEPVLRDLFLPLTAGATLCFPEEEPATGILDWMRREGITCVHTVPSLAASWCEEPAAEGIPSLRLAFLGGEPLHASLVDRLRMRAGAGSVIVNCYGATETPQIQAFSIVPDPPVPGVQPLDETVPGVEVLVMRSGVECSVGEVGEIVVRSRYLPDGYLDARVDATAFSATPGGAHDDRRYRTGDLGLRLANGAVRCLGRRDRQVKLNGVRIELDEISAVASACDGVLRAAAAVAGHGHGARVVLFACVEPVAGPTADQLQRFLADRLPIALLPRSIRIVDRLPQTLNGKADHEALLALVDEEAAPAVAPGTATERSLAQVWQSLLPPGRLGVHDNFFDRGGTSLAALRLVAAVRERHGDKLQLVDVFRRPTIATQAALIDGDDDGTGIDAARERGSRRRRALGGLEAST